MKARILGRALALMMACAVVALIGGGLVAATNDDGQPGIFSPNSHPFGHSYGQWSARWWKWDMERPLPGHPSLDNDPLHPFDVTAGQTGSVWFLAAPLDTSPIVPTQRTCTIPPGKSLFVGLLNAEDSSLEGFPTEADQRAGAMILANHIAAGSLFCTIDGHAVSNLSAFRFQSPQFSFTAPTPWLFGNTGGPGTSVADGYFVMLKHLHPGQHTLHYGGAIHFAIAHGDPFDFDGAIDMTYHLTQLGDQGDDDNHDGD